MQRSRVYQMVLRTPALKRALLVSSARRASSRLSNVHVSGSSPSGASAYPDALLDEPNYSGGIRRRPWEQDILNSCAARKQVRVSLDAVLDVSTGERPWRSSFGEANPEVQPGAEREFARPACNSYASDAEIRKMAEGQLQSAQYLHRELPVRLAHALSALDKMEDTGLTEMPHVARVREDYLQSFRELQETQRPHDRDQVAAFTETVARVQALGNDTVLLMACGLQDLLRGVTEEERAGLERVQDFLDDFYQNRVAMRFLCGHYLALSAPPREGFVGLVQRGVSLTEIAQRAAMEAASICCHALGACPEIRMSVDRAGDGLVAAVPEYVHYVVLELLKNAMRATMQTHGGASSGGGGSAEDKMDVAGEEDARVERRGAGGGDKEGEGGGSRAPIVFAKVPAVNISVKTYGAEDVMLVVADKGGGIPVDATDKVWSYLYTTAGAAVKKSYLANGGNSKNKPPPLAGLGYGLPLSRLYARNFGGELKLDTMAGQGTNATLRLSRHGTRLEPLVWPKATDYGIDEDVYSHVRL